MHLSITFHANTVSVLAVQLSYLPKMLNTRYCLWLSMSGVGLNNGSCAVGQRNWTYTKSYSISAAKHCFQSRHALVSVYVLVPSGCTECQIKRQNPSTCEESSGVSHRSTLKP